MLASSSGPQRVITWIVWIGLLLTGTTIVLLVCVNQIQAASLAPIQLIPANHVGWKVDRTTGENTCLVASSDECQPGALSPGAGGFAYLSSIAADMSSADLYVTDDANNRIEELTNAGVFLATFGWDVNATKDSQSTAVRAERNICTVASGDRCVAGRAGTSAGQLTYPSSAAADSATGDIYVLEGEPGDYRVDKYTAAGRFIWMIGRHVNASRQANICTEREIERSRVTCRAGATGPTDHIEPGSFKFASHAGNLLAAGGPEDLLYVGNEYGVQEFAADGSRKREIPLESISSQPGSGVMALAVDRNGNLYVVYHAPSSESSGHAELDNNIVHKFSSNGEHVLEFPVDAVEPFAPVNVDGIAVDGSGRLAVIGVGDRGGSPVHYGSLYDGDTGSLITEFAVPSDFDGVTFNGDGDMYIAATDRQEVVAYTPAPAVQLLASLVACKLGAQPTTFAALDCALS